MIILFPPVLRNRPMLLRPTVPLNDARVVVVVVVVVVVPAIIML